MLLSNIDEMNLKTYTVQDVSRTTGLSRSFLIKLEKKGIATPSYIDSKTGYRRYTIIDIADILQYRLLREMDASSEEIAEYFNDRDNISGIIDRMKLRRNLLNRAIEELELRLNKGEEYMFSYVELPDVFCYCGTESFVTPKEVEEFTIRLAEEIIDMGYTRFPYEPIFSIRYDTRDKRQGDKDKPYTAKICVPIEEVRDVCGSDEIDAMGEVELIQGGSFFSMLYHGGYSKPDYFNNVFGRFWEELEKRDLKVISEVRAIAIVAPYVGLDIEPNDYVFRFAAMVE